jgi:hypothetical protein
VARPCHHPLPMPASSSRASPALAAASPPAPAMPPPASAPAFDTKADGRGAEHVCQAGGRNERREGPLSPPPPRPPRCLLLHRRRNPRERREATAGPATLECARCPTGARSNNGAGAQSRIAGRAGPCVMNRRSTVKRAARRMGRRINDE